MWRLKRDIAVQQFLCPTTPNEINEDFPAKLLIVALQVVESLKMWGKLVWSIPVSHHAIDYWKHRNSVVWCSMATSPRLRPWFSHLTPTTVHMSGEQHAIDWSQIDEQQGTQVRVLNRTSTIKMCEHIECIHTRVVLGLIDYIIIRLSCITAVADIFWGVWHITHPSIFNNKTF